MKNNSISLMLGLLSLLVLKNCGSTADVKIFYTSNQDGNYEIYEISNIVNTKPKRLTFTASNEQSLVSSPDGSKVIFDYGGTRLERDIFLLDVSSSKIVQLTSALAYDVPGDWSPTENQIAFISDRDGGFYRLYTMDSDGANQRAIPLTNNDYRNVHSVKWSPTDAWILYTVTRDTLADPGLDMFIVNVDSLDVQQINTASTGMCIEGAWSPDGKQIVAVCESGIFLVPLHDNVIKYLSKTKELTDCRSPDWSSDSQWIAFICKNADNRTGLFVIQSDDSELRHLPHGVTGELTNLKEPKWLTNGQQLIYVAESDSTNFVMLTDLDGNSRILIQVEATIRFLSIVHSR